MYISVLSLFPEMFQTLDHSIVGRALKTDLLKVDVINPRDHSTDPHRRVDDRPYGGGPGMVMMAEPLQAALDALRATETTKRRVIYLSPKGKRISQADLNEAALWPGMILIAGRYEGIDQRFIDHSVDELWSIGDYVLSGGELAAMVVIDAVCRLLPGALGCEDSALEDSFQNGMLDHPHYTRPPVWAEHCVPPVLQSGDHQAIRTWRREQALALTKQHRPDLLKGA